MRSLCPLDTWLDKKPPHVLTTHPHHGWNNAAQARRLTPKQSCPKEEEKKKKKNPIFSSAWLSRPLSANLASCGVSRAAFWKGNMATGDRLLDTITGAEIGVPIKTDTISEKIEEREKLARCSFDPHGWLLIDKFVKLVPPFYNGIFLCLLDLSNL